MMNNRYKTMIVDDEPAQLESLTGMLGRFPSYELVASCSSVPEALRVLAEQQPDLLLLDVMLPPDTGFDLLEKLQERSFEVIFTTSHADFAIRALREAAVDYLLKPVGEDVLRDALFRFEQRFREKEKSELRRLDILLNNLQQLDKGQRTLALPTNFGFHCLRVDEILRCESDGNYTTVYALEGKPILICRTMKEFEDLLVDHTQFFRIHRSHIINMRFVKDILKNDGLVRMRDGKELEISRRRREEFYDAFMRL